MNTICTYEGCNAPIENPSPNGKYCKKHSLETRNANVAKALKKQRSKKKCLRCGIEIDRGANGAREYCTPCRATVKREADNSFWKTHERPQKAKKEERRKIYSIPEFNRMAREQGLTYGQLEAKTNAMKGA